MFLCVRGLGTVDTDCSKSLETVSPLSLIHICFNHMRGTTRRSLKSTIKETRLKFYKVMALTTLLCESAENWTLTNSQASRTQTGDMRFLRHIVSILDRIGQC